jgi:hypothetical protein
MYNLYENMSHKLVNFRVEIKRLNLFLKIMCLEFGD